MRTYDPWGKRETIRARATEVCAVTGLVGLGANALWLAGAGVGLLVLAWVLTRGEA